MIHKQAEACVCAYRERAVCVCIEREHRSEDYHFLRIVEFAVSELVVLQIVSLAVGVSSTALAWPLTGGSICIGGGDWVRI